MIRTIVRHVAVLALVPFACGGGGGGNGAGTSSGLPRTDTVGSLIPSDAGLLCDWTNAKQGGYGRAVTCTDGSSQGTDPDKASCIQSVHDFGTACPTLTVADVEDCANAIGQDICQLTSSPACTNLNRCFDMLGI